MSKKLLLIALFMQANLSFATPALLLYGDKDHSKYIGCLNCDKYDSDAICNKYGKYGSKYTSESIWNKYGNYGSKYASTGVWNKYGSEAPLIVDANGNSYGVLSANKYASNRTEIKYLTPLLNLEIDDLDGLRDLYCGS